MLSNIFFYLFFRYRLQYTGYASHSCTPESEITRTLDGMVFTCVRGWAAMAYLRRVGPLHDFLSQLALRRRGLNEQICPKEAACLNSQTSTVERAAKPILRGHQWLCDLNWSNVSEYLCFSCEYSSILSRWGLFLFLLIWYIYIHRVQRFLTDQTC